MTFDPALSMNVEPRPGCAIADACREAQHVADRLGLTVRLVLNGVVCLAEPGGDGTSLAMAYHAALGTQGIARSLRSQQKNH